MFFLNVIRSGFLIIFTVLYSGNSSLFGIIGPDGRNYFPVNIVNDTQIAEDDELFILIKGKNPENGNHCFVKFDTDGWGSRVDVTSTTNSLDYSFSLTEHPGTLYLPKVDSGRIYISIAYPVSLQINPSGSKGEVADTDGFDPRDANYYTLYDKIEFSFLDNGSWMNTTAVDFFSLPIRIEQMGAVSEAKAAGIAWNRVETFEQLKDVVERYDRTENKIWEKLFISYENDDGDTTILRFLSPGKAMKQGVAGTDPFDNTYLSNESRYGFDWMSFIWNFYQTNTFVVDCTILEKLMPLDDYIFTGRVEGDDFVFLNQSKTYEVRLPKPTHSTPFFAAAIAPFDAENDTPKAIIVQQLTSAFAVGLLPTGNGDVLNRKYFIEHRNSYYEDGQKLPITEQGPWYDLYSKAMHSFGDDQIIYSFAYDDALGQDGTLHDKNMANLSSATITISDLTGTAIPHPYDDSQLYDVTVYIGLGSEVYYNGRKLVYGEKLKQVSVPFIAVLNGKEAEIYFNPVIVRPQFREANGIVIKKTGDRQMEIVFPGM